MRRSRRGSLSVQFLPPASPDDFADHGPECPRGSDKTSSAFFTTGQGTGVGSPRAQVVPPTAARSRSPMLKAAAPCSDGDLGPFSRSSLALFLRTAGPASPRRNPLRLVFRSRGGIVRLSRSGRSRAHQKPRAAQPRTGLGDAILAFAIASPLAQAEGRRAAVRRTMSP